MRSTFRLLLFTQLTMISPVSRLRGGGVVPHEIFAEAFCTQIKALEANAVKYHIPRLRHPYEFHPEMPYHFNPELFVQRGGYTEFKFPDEQILLMPGEVCIVPKGMPHGEIAHDGDQPFENIVVSYYSETIDIHLAHAREQGQPRSDHVHFFTTGLYRDMVSYLDRIAEFHHNNARVNAVAIRGLLLAAFSLLHAVVEAPDAHLPTATDLVSQCKWLIQHNLQDDALGLEMLARELECSPNYLSKIFHREVGERIVERISRLRVQSAIDALMRTRLSVKAIAVGCGYADANYFCRVFRQATGRSPQQFREDGHRVASTLRSGVITAPPLDEGGEPPPEAGPRLSGLRSKG